VSEVKRKDNESFESLIRRFTKKTLQSGKLLQARKIRFFKKKSNVKKLKSKALRSLEIEKKIDYLKKIGKFDEFTKRRR
tara:strand:+ start:201 stop:437 length:237 start_codon:yes stop_codon:yes gene_type:complete